MDPGWVIAAISTATLIAGISAWLGRAAWRLGRRTWQFIGDWEGEPASHGHPARPGVLDRLQALENGIAGITAQVHLNSGHSMRDVVSRTETAVTDLSRKVDDLARHVQGGHQP